MKVLGIILASLAILACVGLWVAGLVLPMFYEPVQRMAEPYVCPQDWQLVTETSSCGTEPGAECSDSFCVSPDGSREMAWSLLIFAAATGIGALLFIGAMVLLIVRIARSGARSPAA